LPVWGKILMVGWAEDEEQKEGGTNLIDPGGFLCTTIGGSI
jgi:hypothetical protein